MIFNHFLTIKYKKVSVADAEPVHIGPIGAGCPLDPSEEHASPLSMGTTRQAQQLNTLLMTMRAVEKEAMGEHYQIRHMQNIVESWKNHQAGDLESMWDETGETMECNLLSENRPEHGYYVGDIHGDMNAMLFNIIQSGIGKINEAQPTIIYDCISGRVVDDPKVLKGFSPQEIWHRFRLLPNIILQQERREQLNFVGDILDRGRFSEECLYLLKTMMDQQDEMRKSPTVSDTKTWVTCVVGDHEDSTLHETGTISPGYTATYMLQAGLPWNEKTAKSGYLKCEEIQQKSPSATFLRHTVKNMIVKGQLKYMDIDPFGFVISHSFISEEFIDYLVGELNSQKGHPIIRELEDETPGIIAKITATLTWFQSQLVKVHRQDGYMDHMKTLCEFLNRVYQKEVEKEVGKSSKDNHILLYKLDPTPLFSRHQRRVEIPAVYGHTDHEQAQQEGSGFNVDSRMSYWYSAKKWTVMLLRMDATLFGTDSGTSKPTGVRILKDGPVQTIYLDESSFPGGVIRPQIVEQQIEDAMVIDSVNRVAASIVKTAIQTALQELNTSS